MKMGHSEPCPSGTEIRTADDCKEALKWAYKLGITLQSRTNLETGWWDHVPYQCSYQHYGDNGFHFNYKKTNNTKNEEYRMICKKGKIYLYFVQIMRHIPIYSYT